MATRADITPELCRQLLEYDPETGKLYWRPRPASMFNESRWRQSRRSPEWAANVWNTNNAGLEAFTANSQGYRVGAIADVNLRAHRVAWAIYHGTWPTDHLDHINGDRADNRIRNLRDVPHAENHRNQGRKKCNKSGVNGVIWCKQTQSWRALIKINYRSRCLGRFATVEEAAQARIRADAEFGFHAMHGKRPAYRP
jgi:hypothetical protein